MAFGLHQLFHSRYAAWLTLVAGLTVTAALGWQLHRKAVEMDRQRLAMRVAEITSQLDARLEKSEMLLQNLRDYLMLSGENRNQVFARWCYENGLTINCPWLYGVTVATNRNQAPWKDKLPKPPASWTPSEWHALVELAKTQLVDCVLAMSSEFKDNLQVRSENVRMVRSFHERHPAANAIKGSRITMSYRTVPTRPTRTNLFSDTVYTIPIYQPEVADYVSVGGLTLEQGYAARWSGAFAPKEGRSSFT